jgi:hypothetical protein
MRLNYIYRLKLKTYLFNQVALSEAGLQQKQTRKKLSPSKADSKLVS